MARRSSASKAVRKRARPKLQLVETWPDAEALGELADPDVGVEASDYYRWRRTHSDPPPAMGPSDGMLAGYKSRR